MEPAKEYKEILVNSEIEKEKKVSENQTYLEMIEAENIVAKKNEFIEKTSLHKVFIAFVIISSISGIIFGTLFWISMMWSSFVPYMHISFFVALISFNISVCIYEELEKVANKKLGITEGDLKSGEGLV